MMDLRISVIILTKNSALTIKRCIDSVIGALANLENPWEIIVVDAQSTDGTREILKRYKDFVKIIEDQGRGVGAARNLGVKVSRGDFVFFVDSDCIVEPLHFRKLLDAFDRETGIVWASGLWFKLPSDEKENSLINSLLEALSAIEEPEREGEYLFASTSLMAVRRDVFERIGGFWEYPFACEDMDFAYRALRAGFKIRKLRTKSVSLPRMNLRDLIRQQIWYGRGASIIYYKYRNDRSFWKNHGWEIFFKFYPLNYALFFLSILISSILGMLVFFSFSPSLSIKKKRLVRLSLRSTLIFDAVSRMAYAWGFLSGISWIFKRRRLL